MAANRQLFVLFVAHLMVLSFAKFDTSLFSKEAWDHMAVIHKKCAAESGLKDESLIEQANIGHFVEDPNFKCYIKCITVNFGGMTPDGKMTYELIVDKMPPPFRKSIQHIADDCNKFDDVSDICHKAFLIHKCSFEIDPEYYYLA